MEDPRTNTTDGGQGAGVADAGAADASADGGVQMPASCESNADVFEPGEVYLFGILSGGDCSRHAVAPIDEPNLESVGFTCGAEMTSVAIRPTDGRLLYLDTDAGQLLMFVKDDYGYDAALSQCTYPANPTANDVAIATTACDGAGGPGGFLLAPDDEGIWYTCAGGGVWYDGNHVAIEGTESSAPLARGYGGSVLAAPSGEGGELEAPNDLVLLSSGGNQIAIDGLPGEGRLLAWRAHADGFWIATEGVDEGALQLWNVTLGGEATLEGSYAGPPADVVIIPYGRYVLDSSGALYAPAFDRRQGSDQYAVVKLTLGSPGTAEVLYTEATEPEVRMDTSTLLSGS